MSFLYISKAIKQIWADGWNPTNGIAFWENEVIEQRPSNIPWLRISIRDGDAQQISLGKPSLDRHASVLFVQVFVPINEGVDRARWLADKVAAIFRKKSVNQGNGSLIFDVPYCIIANTLGEETDIVNTGWWQITVLCPFTYDEVT